MLRSGQRMTHNWAVFLCLFVSAPYACCEEVRNQFDSPEVSWTTLNSAHTEVAIHQRRRGVGRTGGAEFIRVSANRENSGIRLEQEVPRATVLDELVVSVWIKSDREGLEFSANIVLPQMAHPVTGQPLTLKIVGDKYKNTKQWQQLKCHTTDRAVNDQIRLLLAQKLIAKRPKEMYLDKVILEGELPPGDTNILIDDLELSPLVAPKSNQPKESSDIELVNGATSSPLNTSAKTQDHQIEFQGHRIYVDKKPFMPRIVTWQGERADVFATSGANVVFVADPENVRVASEMRRHGLWVTSTPPYARDIDGEPLDAEDASLLPFADDETTNILFWTMPPRLNPHGRPKLASWTNQVRNADRKRQLPIAADVLEDERYTSRQVEMVGISKHVIHSNTTLVELRDYINQRRDKAWPDTFIWSWLQTEPAPTLVDLARKNESPPMLEPEQIRLQFYTALSCGCRGIGYWTSERLDSDSPGARERLLVMSQLHLELDLFDPWIASGGTPQSISFSIDPSRTEIDLNAKRAALSAAATKAANKPGAREAASLNRLMQQQSRVAQRDLKAALFRSHRGSLLLPVWLDDSSQFVPGPMAASNVTIVVPGGGDTSTAWEITTTGQLRNLERETAAGGIKIKLPKLDQTAAILITSDPNAVEELSQRVLANQDRSAQISVDLAKLKYERTRRVHQSLPGIAVPHPEDGRRFLQEAKLRLDRAETALRKQQYADARGSANECMQWCRLLQRSDWEEAIRHLPNPTASPWALSFQSLPDHWRLMRQVENFSSLDSLENLLPSGAFDNYNDMVAEGWKSDQHEVENVDSSAELYGVARQGRSSLRLSALQIDPSDGDVFSKPLVSIVSPGVNVRAGQIVRISGWAKIPKNIVGSVEGAMIYDSLLGKPGAVRLKTIRDWQRFELIRPVPESQELSVTISLQGIGELFVDDLRIVAFDPVPIYSAKNPVGEDVSPAAFSTYDRIRQLNPLPKKR